MWVKACIFDLDGVIVDTAKYHYLAWKRLADGMGINFSEKENERLKGVSRMASLEIILGLGRKELPGAGKEKLAAQKNEWYVEYISRMTPDEILPGALEFISELKGKGIKIGLGSASRNTPMILDRVGMIDTFDAVADGNIVHRAKPDPEVFLMAAAMLGVDPLSCIVFEDAVAGVEAALNAGMKCVGIGSREILKDAHIVIKGLNEMTMNKLELLENRI
ncbi:MAG TPA: beta-phosphoglucomutase [Bacteroidales bacterium]|nr:beta-phosphoglucomutase [Bacteroidales bacterium]